MSKPIQSTTCKGQNYALNSADNFNLHMPNINTQGKVVCGNWYKQNQIKIIRNINQECKLCTHVNQSKSLKSILSHFCHKI